jgi:K+/H+ antiporter YhaU regulatory subunit KhtT
MKDSEIEGKPWAARTRADTSVIAIVRKMELVLG